MPPFLCKEEEGQGDSEQVYKEAEREAGVNQDVEGMEKMTQQHIRRDHVTSRIRTMATTGIEQGQGELSVKIIREVLMVEDQMTVGGGIKRKNSLS